MSKEQLLHMYRAAALQGLIAADKYEQLKLSGHIDPMGMIESLVLEYGNRMMDLYEFDRKNNKCPKMEE